MERRRLHHRFDAAHPGTSERRSRLLGFLDHRTGAELWLLALAAIAAIGMLDILTGPNLALSPFYLLPIVLLAWTRGHAAAWIGSGLAAAVWLTADVVSRHEPLATWLHLWNAGSRLAFFIICSTLVVDLRRSHERQRTAAHTDPLTGVANSRWFSQLLAEMLRDARERHIPVSFAYVDVDRFKEINDSFGHSAGDVILQHVANVLRRNLRSEDILARLGGDEFGVALLGETDEAWRPLERAREAIKSELDWVQPSVSIGIATFLTAPETVDEMIRPADGLMYEVKASGRDQVKQRLIFSDQRFREAVRATSA